MIKYTKRVRVYEQPVIKNNMMPHEKPQSRQDLGFFAALAALREIH